MTWRDDLRPASFRGLAFFVDSSQRTGGRRVTFHEFPDRDTPYAEDMGAVGKTFKVEGYLLGADYLKQKKAMLDAADKFGPGELIHPYYGTLQVQCGVCSADESEKEGGFVKLSFQFYDAGDNKFPKTVDDKKLSLLDSALKAKTASLNAFAAKFNVAKIPSDFVNSARSQLAKVQDLYTAATKGVVTVVEGVENLAYSIKNFKAEVGDLLAAPGLLAQRLLDSFDLLGEAIFGANDQAAAFGKFSDFGADAVLPTPITPSRQQEFDNNDALNDFIKQGAVCNQVVAAADADYGSIDEATSARDNLRDLIEDILENATDDDVFAAFKDLNAQLVRVLPDDDAALPSIRKIVLPDTTPSLVLCYDLFETLDPEDDLLARNDIENPLFVPGSVELEVLSDV